MRINNNIMAMNTHRQLGMANSMSSRSMEKLSSGFRINRAGDDAAGLAISEKMRAQIRGLNQASRNSQDAISLIQTAEGALNETHSILQRMRELAVQASTDTNVDVDRDEIQKEINELSSEINRIGASTEFNTQKLINGDKANTLETYTGNYSNESGSTAKAAVTGITGLSGVTFTGSALSSGTNNVVITKTGEAHAAVTGKLGNTSGATGEDIGANISGGLKIASAAGDGSGASLTASGVSIIYDHAAQTVKISGSGNSGTIVDTVNLVDGKLFYDNLGIEFQFNASGLSGNGTLTFAASAITGAVTLDSETVGYSGTSGAAFLTGSITVATPNLSGALSGSSGLPDENMSWTIKISGDNGATGFILSGVGDDGTVIKDSMEVDLSAGGYTYEGYGLKFTISDSGSGVASGGTFSFETTPKFTYKMSVNSGALTVLQSGVGESGLTGNYSGSGISFSASQVIGVSEGSRISGNFNVYTSYESGTDNSMDFQIGANQNQSLNLSISDMRASAVGVTADTASSGWVALSREYADLSGDTDVYKLSGNGTAYVKAFFASSADVTDGISNEGSQYALDMSTGSRASVAITVINDALERVSSERSKMGAYQNRLEHTIANLDTSAENLQASESRIRDVDMAQEMMAFTRNNILTQAAQAMLAQANQAPQGVLQLLR